MVVGITNVSPSNFPLVYSFPLGAGSLKESLTLSSDEKSKNGDHFSKEPFL
jgi:hypothetical protein